MRGNVTRIEADGQPETFEEVLGGNGWDGDERGGVLKAFCVELRTEDGDLVVGSAEGFDALEGLLSVVQSGGEAVNADVGVDDPFGLGPLPGLGREVGFDVAIDCKADSTKGAGVSRAEDLPSRTLKPRSLQYVEMSAEQDRLDVRSLYNVPMLLTGGGGNDIIYNL